MKIRLLFVVLIAIALGVVTQAQGIEPMSVPDDSADIAISFPPPVWVISDSVEIIGTADILDMSSYLIEYQELTFDNEDGIEQWFPASFPGNIAVRNGLVGIWNTNTVRDGLYAIRLVVNTSDGNMQVFRVSPLRVENDPQDGLAGLPPVEEPVIFPTPTQIEGRPTLIPTPTNIAVGDGTVVTAVVDANVRGGDDTSYPQMGFLLRNEQARVIGISSFGSGWFYVELENGRRGWIAPSVVQFNGNIAQLTLYNPPPPPTPPATATAITSANLQITGLRLDPVQPNCAESFDVYINVQNTGTGSSNVSGLLSANDRSVRTGAVTASTSGGFPTLAPGASFVVVVTLTVDTYFEESHDVIVQLDTRSEIPETNEGDNTSSIRYTLNQSACG
jgi:CARDB protein/SH3 domain-containing protein